MAIQTVNFDDMILVATGATKKNQANLYHTWYGWVSKDILHITSRSGAARRKIWHFKIEREGGKNLMLKNTTRIADCWTKTVGENELEVEVFRMNPLAKVEYVDGIDYVLKSRGAGCSHSTSNGREEWWYITTDGQQEVIREAGVVENHFNQYHIGCPLGYDEVRVTGGSFAANWNNKHQLRQVYVVRGTNLESVALQLKVQDELWWDAGLGR